LIQEANGAQLHGDAKAAALKAGVQNVGVSISHTDEQVVAVAVAHF
jgi:fatty acid synthase subunit alpha, fungi type